jgi:hypothetical protein
VFWNKNNKPGWFGLKLNDYGTALESGDYSAIPWVFCMLAENHAAAKNKAAEFLCEALEKLTFDELVRIDEQMRQTTSMEWSIDWRNCSINSFFTPEMGEAERRAVIIFASFSPNGFIRERAVRLMKDYSGTLPFAILRQNDWVSQIRSAAVETADYRLAHLSKSELVAALPFADKLSRSGRSQSSNTYVKRIYTALTANKKELIAGLSSVNIRTRRICTNAMFNFDNPRYALAFDRLQQETDPFLRASLFRRLVSAGQNMDVVADQFLKDKYPLNRVLAFQYICSANQNKALTAAKELLLDKSASIRENARFYLNKNVQDFDCRAYYKSNLMDCTVPAIYGLGETGKSEDVAEIESYLKSDVIAVVRATMTAVMRLDGEKYAAKITEFLADNRISIVKTARNLIIKSTSPDYSKVMGIFRDTSYENTKQKCFLILLTASKWQRLIYILDVLENNVGDMTKKAEDAINRWIGSYNCSYVVATPAQIEAIAESIRRLGGRLSAKTGRQLLFLLQ